METMKVSILSACMLSAAAGVCTLLRPERSLERPLRLLLSMLLILSIAAPLKSLDLPASLEVMTAEREAAQAEALREHFEENLLAETRARTEGALRERLEAAGITCTSLSVTLYIDEADCIYCTEAEAECDDLPGACAVLEAALGKEAEIRVTQILT